MSNLELRLGDEDFEATPFNTTLFTFLGRAALNGIEIDLSRFNHVFLQRGEVDEQTMSGSYIFRTERNSEVFDAIVSHIVEHNYPMILNRRDVPDCDVDAYNRTLDQIAASEEVGDFIPDGWLDGTTES
jgi:hypothetical protein